MTRMRKTDFSKYVLDESRRIRTALKSLLKAVANPVSDKDKHQTYRLLVRLQVSVERIYQLGFPPTNTGEIFGMPEEATEAQFLPKPTAISRSKGWDFMPWFRGKVNSLRKDLNNVFELIETGGFKGTTLPKKTQQSMLSINIQDAIGMTDSLIEVLTSGDVSITEIRPPMAEEE